MSPPLAHSVLLQILNNPTILKANLNRRESGRRRMMQRFKIKVVLVAVILALSPVLGVNHTWAAEPDRNLTPNFGSVTLKAGFTPDPFTKSVVAGGGIKTELGGVKATVARAPDFKLYYTAEVRPDGSLPYPLRIYVESKRDTTLLINLPDGTWVANDDGGGNSNPLLRFGRPQSGRYDIWVGTFGHGESAAGIRQAILRISEK